MTQGAKSSTNWNVNCITMFQSAKANHALKYFSDGVLCPEIWLVLIHTHAIQFTSLRYTCGVLRILSLYHRSSLTLIYMYIFSIKLYMFAQNFIAAAVMMESHHTLLSCCEYAYFYRKVGTYLQSLKLEIWISTSIGLDACMHLTITVILYSWSGLWHRRKDKRSE